MWKLLSSSCARWDVKHTAHQSFNIKLDTQGENISLYVFMSMLHDIPSDMMPRFELWILCCCVTSIILIHDLVTPSECRWNQISVVIDMAQWGHASALAALQRLGRRLSLRDGFRGCEEAPSRQPDASKTLLHTFHLSTAWPRHEGIQMKRMGSTVVCRISILFKMTFDT